MYVCRRFVPSSTGSPYPPSSRRGTLRYLHESTAKVAIFANLRKHLPVFFSIPTYRLRFFSLFSLCTPPLFQLPYSPSFLPLVRYCSKSDALSSRNYWHPTWQIVNSSCKSPTNRQEKEWNVRTLLRKLYLCLNIRVDFSQRAAQLLGHWQESLVLSCEKIHTLCTLFKGYHLKLKTLHGSFPRQPSHTSYDYGKNHERSSPGLPRTRASW